MLIPNSLNVVKISSNRLITKMESYLIGCPDLVTRSPDKQQQLAKINSLCQAVDYSLS